MAENDMDYCRKDCNAARRIDIGRLALLGLGDYLMGDAAIRAVNMIAKRNGEPCVIPAGSTYKIRGGDNGSRFAKIIYWGMISLCLMLS